jgi:preprotein translocase subunit SecD
MSDYIERLRAELLRAEATTPRRARVAWRPLAVAAALALLIAAVVTLWPSRTDEVEVAGTTTTYRVVGDAERIAEVMRARLAGQDARVELSHGTLFITAPVDVAPYTRPGKLGVYDFEASRLNDAPVSRSEAEALGGLPVRAEDGSGWYALRGTPPLTNAAVASAKASTDPMSKEPVVDLQLNPQGQRAFTDLTRIVAQRGLGQEFQHIAIVVDDQLVSTPYIDGRSAPDGIDGAEGMYIPTPAAGELAVILDSGPLPGSLR